MTTHAPSSKAGWLTRVLHAGFDRYVPRFDTIIASQWRDNRSQCLTRIQKRFSNESVAVRSSKHNESGGAVGQAGRYRSLGPVSADRRRAMMRAIDTVFASYGEWHDADEVLIQVWVADAVAMLGVTSAQATSFAGTASLSYCIGGSTNAITAGWTNVQRFWLTDGASPSSRWPSAVRRAFAILSSLESELQQPALELEVAVDSRGRMRLLQVSPSTRRSVKANGAPLENRRKGVELAYDQRVAPRKGELGRRTLFGLMPDWNPAELLGEHPRPLALSLFSELVTNRVWREARINLGYRRALVHPLLGVFAGRPYVDVRASLNSLIPQGIADAIAAPVIDASIDKLRRRPELHDRIETELQPTCIGFAHEGARQLSDAGLGTAEQRMWHDALVAMEPIWHRFSTAPMAHEHLAAAVKNIETRCLSCNTESELKSIAGSIQQALALPFAMHARLAFVARFQLASLVTAGALSPKRLDSLLSCISAITSVLGTNLQSPSTLRPATFDISVEPVQMDAVVKKSQRSGMSTAPTFKLTNIERRAITLLLRSLRVESDAESWIANAMGRIELRERWKYGLSQAVSNWLSATTLWGKHCGLNVDELSFLTVRDLDSGNGIDGLRRRSVIAKKRYDIEGTIKMPLLISDRRDFRACTDPALRPTFQSRAQAHGRGQVSAAICRVGRHNAADVIAPGAVVLIHAADPGYDWIFQYPLGALVTCYGGPHSHMAVRCAELNVPCVLGCGETVYGALREATHITIDFEQQHMRVGP